MNKTAFAVCLALLAGLGAILLVRTAAGLDAYRTLEMALATDSLLDYSGQVRIQEAGRPVTWYSILHEQPNRDIIHYTSPKRYSLIVIRRTDRAVCMDPDNGEIFAIPGVGTRSLRLAPRLIRENYRIRVLGSDQMASRKAIRLSVTPRYSSAVRREVWIDTEKFLVLCSRDLNLRGETMYEERFTTVEYGPGLRTDFAVGIEKEMSKAVPLARQEDPQAMTADLGFRVSPPSRVPKGYVPVGTYMSECPCGCGAKAALFRYTDGLNGLSVFQTIHSAGQCGLGGSTTMQVKEGHCVVIRSGRDTMAIMEKKGVHVIAIGNLPANVLGSVANAVPATDGKSSSG